MSRRARARTSLFGIALLFLVVPLWWSAHRVSSLVPRGDSDHAGFVVPADFPATLIRAGLDPKALAAAGVSSGTVGSVLQAAADTINANPNALPSADTAFMSARPDVDRLAAKIQSGLATQEDFTAYQAATSALATATTQRQTALDNIFTSAIANLSAGQRATLTQIRVNRAQDMSASHPTEFLVLDRSQEDWVSLRDCLANEHIAIKYPDTLDQGAQAQLAAWRADPAVSAAKNSLDANLAAVTTAWNTAAGVQ
jgi:hypothetical protein